VTALEEDTGALLSRATRGEAPALDALFTRHRARLLRMARRGLDPRLYARVDPDDVVQEVYAEAARRLREYELQHAATLPFFLWLRLLTAQELAELARVHLGAARRDARREVAAGAAATHAHDSALLAAQICGHLTSPTEAAARGELRVQIARALDSIAPADREMLVLRHFEQLTGAEAARELGLASAAASKRYVRALHRLRAALVGLGILEP
jgi:RNA polymerase sigma-70 factor (ECF subfamily)